MENSIRVFNNYLINEKKSSSNTIESYMRDVLQFSDFCAQYNIKKISKINSSTVKNYFHYLTAQNKSDATKLRIIASLRSFFRCLTAKGLYDGNPLEGINIKKRGN